MMINTKCVTLKIFYSLIIVYTLYAMFLGILYSKGTMFGVVLNFILLAIVVLIHLFKEIQIKKFLFVYIFILYVGLLIYLQSGDYAFSLKSYFKWMLGFLALPVSYSLADSFTKYRLYFSILLVLMVLYVVNVILANIFGFGGGYNNEDIDFEVGNLFSGALYINCLCIVAFHFFSSLKKETYKYILVLTLVCAILVVINMKRTAIASLLIGVIVYNIVFYKFSYSERLSQQFSKINSKKIFFVIFFFIAIFYSKDLIISQFNARSDRFEVDNFKDEGRIQEFLYVFDEIVVEGDIKKVFFGKETLNVVGTYANGLYGDRKIHGDYAVWLHSSGLIGLFLLNVFYLYLFSLLFKRSRFLYKKTRKKSYNYITAYVCAIFAMFFVNQMSGFINSVSYPMVFFTIIGITMRYLDVSIGIYNNKK